MTSRREVIVLAALGAGLGIAFWRWQESAATVPASSGVTVRAGSRLGRDGALSPGRVVTKGSLAASVASRALTALAKIPHELRPESVTLDIDPRYADGAARVLGLELQRDARSIVVGDGGTEADASVWLHELGHVRLTGSRPVGPVARRLTDAIEEGAADYFAATLSGNPVLGTGEAQRDLRQPPHVGPSEWASLAFAGFDTHRMGWLLAARLYQLDPKGGSLLRDVVASLDGESELGRASDSPAAVIAALLEACPEDGRSRLARVLSDWLPEELRSVEIPT